ncbi:MAG: peptidylprolyl isomerase [Candidatus Moranbacteria bacterium]|nr:peptidylprolyl isomerase [Candidatus Moranbacteria bacterium]
MRKKIYGTALIAVAMLLSGCTMRTAEVRKESKAPSDLNFFSETKNQSAAVPQKKPESEAPQTPPVPPSNNVTKKKMYTTQPPMTLATTKEYSATLKTDAGDIVLALDAKTVPITVNNFVFLAREKFYENTIFHRTIKGFMIQGGDPEGTGGGGPGYKFADEPFTGEYTRGTLAMANAGPNTNGSQFFIVHKDTALPKSYVIFGRVTAGLDVVDTIAEAKTLSGGEGSSPVTPVQVQTVVVTEK